MPPDTISWTAAMGACVKAAKPKPSTLNPKPSTLAFTSSWERLGSGFRVVRVPLKGSLKGSIGLLIQGLLFRV